MRRENSAGRSHTCQLPKGEQFSTPDNDRKCIHKPGPSVMCEVEAGCKRSFGRACLKCDKVV